MITTLLLLALTQTPTVRLQDEGSGLGQATTLNCVGDGITCTWTPYVGTLTVTSPTLSHVRATTATAGSYVTADVVQYSTETYDTLNEYAPTVTWAFTATTAGYYHISAAIFTNTQAWALGNSCQIYIQKNGTTVAYGYRAFAPSAANWYLTSAVDTTILLAPTDVVRATINHDRAAGNVTLFTDANGNYFTVDRLP